VLLRFVGLISSVSELLPSAGCRGKFTYFANAVNKTQPAEHWRSASSGLLASAGAWWKRGWAIGEVDAEEDGTAKRRSAGRWAALKYRSALLGLRWREVARRRARINGFAGAVVLNVTCLFHRGRLGLEWSALAKWSLSNRGSKTSLLPLCLVAFLNVLFCSVFPRSLLLITLEKRKKKGKPSPDKDPRCYSGDGCVSLGNLPCACLDSRTSSRSWICGEAFPESLQ